MIDFCILGAGISGSTIANLLKKKYSVLVVDKAKGVGGRASNKKINKKISFDHGLQYFTARNNLFKNYLNKLIKKRVLKEWHGNHIDFTFDHPKNRKKIIGVKGNNDLNKFLLKGINTELDNEITRIIFNGKNWKIIGKRRDYYAKSLIVSFPYYQAIKLARKYLSKKISKLNVKMEPNITLLLEQKSNKEVPFSSLRLNNKIIAWIANENSKNRFSSSAIYWTIQSSIKFSKKIINVYKKDKIFYSNQMIKEFVKIFNIKNKLKLIKIHGWKFSYSRFNTGVNCFWNQKFNIGVCGDWFIGPNAESAWLSANNLFNEINKNPPK